VAADIIEIVNERLGAGLAMTAEHVDTDDLAEVGRAAEKAAGLLGPFGHRLAALDELGMAARHLPAAVDPRITGAGSIGG
jgi:hypothetical protein